jgi:hypothetical protein
MDDAQPVVHGGRRRARLRRARLGALGSPRRRRGVRVDNVVARGRRPARSPLLARPGSGARPRSEVHRRAGRAGGCRPHRAGLRRHGVTPPPSRARSRAATSTSRSVVRGQHDPCGRYGRSLDRSFFQAVGLVPAQPGMQTLPGQPRSAATSVTVRPSLITASTARYRCSATLISLIPECQGSGRLRAPPASRTPERQAANLDLAWDHDRARNARPTTIPQPL